MEAAEETGGLPEVHAAAALINALTGVQASPANVSDEGVLETPVCATGALLPGAPADDPMSIRDRRVPWLEARSLDAAADPLALFRARFRAVTENVWYSQGQEFGLRGAPEWGVEGPSTNDVQGRVDGVASRSGIWSPLARASGARSPLACSRTRVVKCLEWNGSNHSDRICWKFLQCLVRILQASRWPQIRPLKDFRSVPRISTCCSCSGPRPAPPRYAPLTAAVD